MIVLFPSATDTNPLKYKTSLGNEVCCDNILRRRFAQVTVVIYILVIVSVVCKSVMRMMWT